MKKPSYEVWEVIEGRTDLRVSLEALIDDWEGFRLLLRDFQTDRMIRIAFPSVIAYQTRDESDLDGESARSTGLKRGSFYQSINSEFLDRFVADSARTPENVVHFLVVTNSDCVDVLTSGRPVVTRL